MNFDTAIAFILGLLFGFFIAAYLLRSSDHSRSETEQLLQPEQVVQLMQQQMAYAQHQNMLRQLQLEQAKQEQEFRALERNRTVYLAGLNRD